MASHPKGKMPKLFVLTSPEALRPLADAARRDGPALVSDLVALARQKDADAAQVARIPGMVKALEALTKLLAALPASQVPTDTRNEEDDGFVPSPPSGAVAFLERQKAAERALATAVAEGFKSVADLPQDS